MRIPKRPPRTKSLMDSVAGRVGRLQAVMSFARDPCPGGRYRHWDKLLALSPPGDLTHEEWWLAIKLARRSTLKQLDLRDVNGAPFWFCTPDPALEMLHRVDSDAGGQIQMPEQVTNPATRDRYIVRSLVEEAITSSQLEGAVTTRLVAKEMIRTGRQPTDHSELMCMNNYLAMQEVRDLSKQPLTPEVVCNLHRTVTSGTLDDPSAAGRLRRGDKPVRVMVVHNNEVVHTPPPASELPGRLAAMCDFANRKTPDYFVHPVVRAIVLHFWLAYDHPFEDGNGRTARALFYWSMLSQGYWLGEFISISPFLVKAPVRYTRAFLYSETDENDMTYFILFHLKLICRAIDELYQYLERKMADLRKTERILRQSAHVNHRQLALLSHGLRHADARYTFRSHMTSHGVTYQTARTDLLGLAAKGLLVRHEIRRTFYFSPADNLEARLGGFD